MAASDDKEVQFRVQLFNRKSLSRPSRRKSRKARSAVDTTTRFPSERNISSTKQPPTWYTIDPLATWKQMKPYKYFSILGTKFGRQQFVRVAHTLKESSDVEDEAQSSTSADSHDDWIAYVLEVRAANPLQVYARVYWMYWPDEIPPGTWEGSKSVHGRQPHHRPNELIASNHMDVINVMSVNGMVDVGQAEDAEGNSKSSYFFRQEYDCLRKKLYPV